MALLLSALHAAVINSAIERSLQQERRFLTREDATALDDKTFISLFRLDKESFRELCAVLRPKLENLSERSNTLTVETKVLCALRFFGTGCYQKSALNDKYLSVSQSSASRAISQVSEAANELLLNKWVNYPTSIRELKDVKQEFKNLCKIPGVAGVIDCTHIAIVAPKEDENIYLCSEGYHSINVQLVCDTRMRIINVNAKFPGSVDNISIWKSSALYHAFSEGHVAPDSWLLGDQSYPLEPWLMTPVTNVSSGTAEEHYNSLHTLGWQVIEKCKNLLRSRFRCLSERRKLYYTPVAAGKIINTCVILHNMCIEKGVPILDSDTADVIPSKRTYNARKRVKQ